MLSNNDYSKAFHEIKNSVALINSSLQLLEKQHPELKDYSLWSNSLQSLAFLREMVLKLSMVRSSERIALEPVNINAMLNNIIRSIQSLKWSNSFVCQTNITPDLPIIQADACRLTQAVINLLKNSYEAMNRTGTCYLNAYADSDNLHIDIIDFGGGIDPDIQPHLFVPFTTSKENGTGLGLNITKEIIENYHGTLSYESRENDGCTFYITLPV